MQEFACHLMQTPTNRTICRKQSATLSNKQKYKLSNDSQLLL